MESECQEQTAPDDRVLTRARATVRNQPSPPRPVETARLALAMYPGKLVPLALLVAAGTTFFVITFFQSGGPLSLWFLRLLTGGGTLFFLLAPGQNGVTVARWVRDGLLARADVVDVHLGVDNCKRPKARGRRLVHHPILGDFHDEFSIVAPWADAITAGSTLAVLVPPSELKTWVTLGLNSAMGLRRTEHSSKP